MTQKPIQLLLIHKTLQFSQGNKDVNCSSIHSCTYWKQPQWSEERRQYGMMHSIREYYTDIKKDINENSWEDEKQEV